MGSDFGMCMALAATSYEMFANPKHKYFDVYVICNMYK